VQPALVGTPSDEAPGILAAGGTDVTTIYVAMSERHPEGGDAAYLAWHLLDHRPEQHRLPSLRASFRLVSTPACRAARIAADGRYDAVDHVMTYLFTGADPLPAAVELNVAITEAGRAPYLLPDVARGVYRLEGTAAAPRIKVGADVLPWWPAKGAFVLVERGPAPASELVEVDGVGGAWWGAGLPMGQPFTSVDNDGLQITYCFLDDEPPAVAERLRPLLEQRELLLAAPFYTPVPYEWDRHLPS
jgi:hypothetical protein